MIKIAHRGNINGPNPEKENHPDYIMEAIDLGYDVESDVWIKDGKFYLGHDKPMYKIYYMFLFDIKEHLWAHAKNTDALVCLLEKGIHCFWHEEDQRTLTTEGYIWTFPGRELAIDRSIAVMPEKIKDWDISKAVGVCTDFADHYT